MLDKTFTPSEVESRIYESWEAAGVFRAGRSERIQAKPYTIVIPPPNVTGSLHMGHALNNTLQDVLIRFERMRGRDALWQPGMDHAGIATQMVVERQLEQSGVHRRDLGREEFVRRIWSWKEQSGGMIINQLKRLGASCDWSRERFTMDEGLSDAVLKVFVELHRAGLIYKDKRLVNWDPKFLTAISDLEVQPVETKGHLWHLRYPVKDGGGRYVVVATTRPETMLGDTAVAVHPDDERYKDLIGKHVVLPLVGREIPIVADEHADPETGSGAVKITPAHDFNDFEVGKRHDLPMINVLDAHARINENAPDKYIGMDRYEARKLIVEDLEALELVDKIEDHVHMVPYGDRSNVVIEPWLTDQWYVDAATLAKPAIEAVERGETVFVPRNWEKTYFEWMRNIQPWCISRQLWWGHQIPAWYAPDGEVFVAESEEAALAQAREKYGEDVTLERDPDVLDTWFSSALWPFSTLGWPNETPELQRYYKTDVLVTGFDIIFFWVARMMMMGLHFMKEVPFHTVYIHALVRDAKGQKMSKSKGNVIDPLDLVSKYGADALRFTLSAMAAQGRDIKLSEQRVEGYRNFATKLWNAARFCEMNGCVGVEDFDPAGVKETLNRWIVGETEAAARAITEGIEAYKFNEGAGAAYRFVWNVFCDWYLELAKPVLSGEDGPAKDETRATTAWVLDQILKLLHPFMPYVTEELWTHLGEQGPARTEVVALSAWPNLSGLVDANAKADVDWLIDLVTAVRSVRSEMNVPAGARLPLVLVGSSAEVSKRAARYDEPLKRLARLEAVSLADIAPAGSVQTVVGESTVALPIADVVDLGAERERLQREVKKLSDEIGKIDAKLANANFVSRAPEHVVEEQRERRAEAEDARAKLTQALERLAGAA
ncbi:valine--tRNA ligase [Microbaculum marinisediminis]|uniref:Valine--tRNA ligase n=1 Tax=Microbaculum marinisediminis TaxID=2931392 RepID=A0AAW5R538_9HYPH|nr:valine--tRNA ligase [Microbaculum sp. A6E488]MCT8974018.1 valine--tRNA ligase [Microbaculum sp. A6E488]